MRMKRNGKIGSSEKKTPLRVGTLFSGIGAIEQALLRTHVNHEIVFACDNGDTCGRL